MIKMLAIDMDGTLLNSFSRISSADLNALYRLKEAGILIVPATGRTISALPHSLMEHPDLFRYIISSNGAVLYDRLQQKNLALQAIPHDLAADLVDTFRYDPVFLSAHIDHEYWVDGKLMQINGRIVFGKDALKTKVAKNLSKIIKETSSPIEEIQLYFLGRKTKEKIKQKLKDFPELHGAFTSAYVEIFDRMASKGKALKNLAEQLGIEKEEIACIGDGENDVLMFSQAGLSIAMGNAKEAIQEKADRITKSHNQNGVAYAIDEYILKQ